MINIQLGQGPQAHATIDFRPSSERSTPHGKVAQEAADFINATLEGKSLKIVSAEPFVAPVLDRAVEIAQIQARLKELGVEVDLEKYVSIAIIEKLQTIKEPADALKPAAQVILPSIANVGGLRGLNLPVEPEPEIDEVADETGPKSDASDSSAQDVEDQAKDEQISEGAPAAEPEGSEGSEGDKADEDKEETSSEGESKES